VPAPPRNSLTVPNAIGLTRYVAFGDSITYGSASGFDPRFLFSALPGAYPERLLAGLETYFEPHDFTMFNEGQPGQWATQALDRFNIMLGQRRPQAVLLLMGFNDLNSLVSIADTITGLKRMLDAAGNAGVAVIVATMYQTYEVTDPQGVYRWNAYTEIEPFNVEVKKLPIGRRNVFVVDLYPLMTDPALVGGDGVHTTPQGNEIIASAFMDAIEAAFPVRGNTQ
jgi:lysophospholipase L1-like esterase